MSITDEGLLEERPHHISGTHRIYRFTGGWGLSLINNPMAHFYPFAWEAAVIRVLPRGSRRTNGIYELDYSTDLTSDVEVFFTDEEANAFIQKAKVYFENGVRS